MVEAGGYSGIRTELRRATTLTRSLRGCAAGTEGWPGGALRDIAGRLGAVARGVEGRGTEEAAERGCEAVPE